MENDTGNRSAWRRMNEQTSFSGLFRTMPYAPFELVSVLLLSFVAAIPLLAALMAHTESIRMLRNMSIHAAFQSVGNIGLIFGCVLFLWFRFNRADARPGLRQRLRSGGLIIFLGAMLMWSVLSTVFSTNPARSFSGTTYRMDGLSSYFGYAGIFFLALALRDRRKQRVVLNIFSACAAVLALLCLLDIPEVYSYCHLNKKMAIFANWNHYAYYLCMAAMSVALLFVTAEKRRSRLLSIIPAVIWLAELVLICHGLIMSETLGTLLAMLFALLVMLVLTVFIDRKKLSRVALVIAVSVVSFYISSIGAWDLGLEFDVLKSDFGKLESAASSSAEDDAGAASDIGSIGSLRGSLWISALTFISERPVFGYGPDNLGERYAQTGEKNDRPHCELLQFAASLGIPAMLFYISAMVSHLLMFIRNFRRLDMTVLCSYCTVLAYLASSLFGNTMFYTTPFFFMLLALSYAAIRPVDERAEAVALAA